MNKLLPDISKTLLSSAEIARRVSELAQQIDDDSRNLDQLLILGILRGAFIFIADLTRQLQTTHVVDFMALTSYSKNKSTGEVRILMDSREPIKDQHILIVEDIIDSGDTLNHLCRTLLEREPASLRTCVLVRKKRADVKLDIPIDYIGFEIPDVWVVGYGLDYDNYYRTLPYIAELATMDGSNK
jgi:hypoxanthine phosphoribosyltransferase